MKKCMAIVWAAFFCCSAAQAAQFHPEYKTSISPIYEYYADFGTTSENMVVGGTVDTTSYPVRIQIPSMSKELTLFYLPGYDDYYKYTYVASLQVSQGFPPIGTAYEDIQYVFYIDVDFSGSLTPGDPTDAFILPSGSIREAGFVTDVHVTPGNHPTVTWKKIAAYDDLIYRIRLHPIGSAGLPDKSVMLFQSEPVSPVDGTFTCTYTGDLFDEYYTLALAVEAIEVVDGRIPYRSRYFINHSKYFQSTVPGDMNGDNKLDLKDIVTGLRVISGSN